MPPRKRRPEELASVVDPTLTDASRESLAEGIRLFNSGSYWHAHEAWEIVWLAMGDGAEDDGEYILRGLIQLAAALHLLEAGRLDGSTSNFRKAREKLGVAGDRFLGIAIPPLLEFIDQQLQQPDPKRKVQAE